MAMRGARDLPPRMSNRDIERYYFEKFRQDFPLPKGEITYRDKPDVIVHGEKRIGIEITRLFLEDGTLEGSEQVQRDRREKVVSLAREIYSRNDGKSFELSFSFNKESRITSVKQLAVRVATLAKSLEGHPGGPVNEDTFQNVPELSFVFVDPREYEDPRWRVVQPHSGPGVMSEERLRNVIHRKEEDARSYKPCDAYWLLVVVDSFDRAQEQEIRTDGLGRIDSQTFEKVIIYETPFGNIVDVK
jgi:hypothetical protein